MEEKILQTRKNGMAVLLLTLLGYAAAVALFVYSIVLLDDSLFPGVLLLILAIAYCIAGIFLFCGLRVQGLVIIVAVAIDIRKYLAKK